MNNEKKKPELPIALALVEAEEELVSTINKIVEKYRIPFYLLEPSVKNAARQVSENAKAEREKARQIYNNQLEEYNKSKGESQ